LNPNIPDWLAALIDKLHAKDPAERPQSASEVAQALGRRLEQLQHPAGSDFGLRISDCRLRNRKSAIRNRQSTMGRRRWPLAAAAIVALPLLGILLTEATGVTQVVPTVMRIVTGEGVLIVELNEPGVKVTVEKDGGLAIAIAGDQAVRLPAGANYRVRARKDGQPLPLDPEVVTIHRGDRQVVRVRREAVGTASAAKSEQAWKSPPHGPLDALDPAKIPAGERFDWQPPELVQVLGTHRGMMWNDPATVVVSPDGTSIASAGYDGIIYLWDSRTLELRRMLKGHGSTVWGLAFLPDSRRLISGGEDKLVRIWDSSTGEQIGQFAGHTGHVWCVAVAPDGLAALSGGADGAVRLWTIATGTQIHAFEGHSGNVCDVAISPDGKRAISGGVDDTMRLWDLDANQPVHRFGGHSGDCRRVQFLPDGRRAISCSHDHTLRLWDLEKREEIRSYLGHGDDVYGLAMAGEQLVSAGKDGTIRVWDVETATEQFRLASPSPLFGFSSVAALPGQRIATGGHDGAIRLWDLEKRAEIDPGRLKPLLSNASRLSISDDGRRVLASLANVAAVVYDVPGGTVLRTFPQPRGFICATLSPDGGQILCGDQQGLSAWSVESGKRVREFPGSLKICHVVFSSDGRTILTGDYRDAQGGAARLWNAETGEELVPLGAHGPAAVTAVALSKDAHRALSGANDKLRLWNLESGTLVYQWQHTQRIWSVALSPDGRYAASSDDGGYVQVRDLSTPEPKLLQLAKIHTHWVRSVAFSPDSRQVLSAGYDGRLVLRKVPGGETVQQWQYPGFIHAAEFLPDNRHIATLNGNGTVYVLRLKNPEPRTLNPEP
jgi:WD40 repeat protein